MIFISATRYFLQLSKIQSSFWDTSCQGRRSTIGYLCKAQTFDKQCKEECLGENILRTGNCSCKVSTLFDEELPKGVSYCKIEDEVKKLSFVFVASTGDQSSNDKLNSESRGCSIYFDSFRNPKSKSFDTILNLVPAYLIVFSI